MARGWESKAVTDQIEEGKQPQKVVPRSSLTPEDRRLKERLESLRLSRSRLLQQLDRATQPAYREVLLKGLGAIEKEIEEVEAQVRAIEA